MNPLKADNHKKRQDNHTRYPPPKRDQFENACGSIGIGINREGGAKTAVLRSQEV